MANKKEERFAKTFSQGFWGRTMEIWVDKKTGVNYLCTQAGYSGGITPLLNRDGSVVVTPIPRTYEE